MESVIRLLPYAETDGATNMAADEALVRSASNGIASLRFYGWSPATLSLGYFQPHAIRHSDPRLANLPWVRRPSGGATLVHHHELTYALALPAGDPWKPGPVWMQRMHGIITTALAELGLPQIVKVTGCEAVRHGDILCFQQFTCGDLLSADKKIVGSAQRKYRQAFLQHGSILLAQSEHTPALPGLRETAGVSLSSHQVQEAVLRVFARDTGWHLNQDDWTPDEITCRNDLIRERYATAEWNERR